MFSFPRWLQILCVVEPSVLKLCQNDQLLYDVFRKNFADFNVKKLDEPSLKSKEAKEKWRPFMNDLQKEVEDFSFATLVSGLTETKFNSWINKRYVF